MQCLKSGQTYSQFFLEVVRCIISSQCSYAHRKARGIWKTAHSVVISGNTKEQCYHKHLHLVLYAYNDSMTPDPLVIYWPRLHITQSNTLIFQLLLQLCSICIISVEDFFFFLLLLTVWPCDVLFPDCYLFTVKAVLSWSITVSVPLPVCSKDDILNKRLNCYPTSPLQMRSVNTSKLQARPTLYSICAKLYPITIRDATLL